MYFESVLYSVCHYDCFHVYGHLDYILRYLPEGVTVDMKQFAPLLDRILTELIARGKGIEVNTSRLARGGVLNPSPKILARYRELGGTLLTIGSDAHRPDRIAGAFTKAEAVLKDLGYKEYTTFLRGKPSFRKL
jgi:histidinol-phosphatase (PHP family)